ncbi:hypothetical protein ITP53_25720 [Nonomuraea sp. K274]|uniref:Integrase n=1 Tax=Nonomuraea cypriaca TaxID=1187855 RepID=A0A931A9Y3_9ACTN|nr:hypothetical protein [Nonomuraea cypriaca]MBF8189072.1 hypothetical protein [Nonomuraea cypriaca]
MGAFALRAEEAKDLDTYAGLDLHQLRHSAATHLGEAAARASEILSLNVENLLLEERKAPLRSKGGATQYYGLGIT